MILPGQNTSLVRLRSISRKQNSSARLSRIIQKSLPAENFRILTLKFKINFFKPEYGSALKCRSKVINKGKQIIVPESKVYNVRDKSEKLVAKVIVTMMAVPAEKIVNASF